MTRVLSHLTSPSSSFFVPLYFDDDEDGGIVVTEALYSMMLWWRGRTGNIHSSVNVSLLVIHRSGRELFSVY